MSATRKRKKAEKRKPIICQNISLVGQGFLLPKEAATVEVEISIGVWYFCEWTNLYESGANEREKAEQNLSMKRPFMKDKVKRLQWKIVKVLIQTFLVYFVQFLHSVVVVWKPTFTSCVKGFFANWEN